MSEKAKVASLTQGGKRTVSKQKSVSTAYIKSPVAITPKGSSQQSPIVKQAAKVTNSSYTPSRKLKSSENNRPIYKSNTIEPGSRKSPKKTPNVSTNIAIPPSNNSQQRVTNQTNKTRSTEGGIGSIKVYKASFDSANRNQATVKRDTDSSLDTKYLINTGNVELDSNRLSIYSYKDLKDEVERGSRVFFRGEREKKNDKKTGILRFKPEGTSGLYRSESGSINDPSMGVTAQNEICATCHLKDFHCRGHIGMLDFENTPIYNIVLLKYLIQVLQSVCKHCGKLLITEQDIIASGIINTSGPNRLQKVSDKASKVNGCLWDQPESEISELTKNAAPVKKCGVNPIYKTTKSIETCNVIYIDKDGSPKPLPIDEVIAILDNISDKDARLMGFSDRQGPSNLILRGFPVIPPSSRRPQYLNGQAIENQITEAYVNMIKILEDINDIKRDKESKETLDDKRKELAEWIKALIDNSDGKKPIVNKPLISIKQQIQGKEGMLRNLMQGKRVDYSARTVLSPAPNIQFGTIKIPRSFAKKLTTPIYANAQNFDYLNELLWKGKIRYIKDGKGFHKVKNDNRRKIIEQFELNYNKIGRDSGIIFHRWAEDGDVVIFNRQPTLHQYGIMSASIVITGKEEIDYLYDADYDENLQIWKDPITGDRIDPSNGNLLNAKGDIVGRIPGNVNITDDESTIGIFMPYTKALNADFDGDEGNIHSVQSTKARAELETLVHVKDHIINAQNNTTVMGLVYDALSSAFALTYQKGEFIDTDLFMDALMLISVTEQLNTLEDRLASHGIPYYTGRALFSAPFPEDFSYNRENVVIEDGVLISGVITSSDIGNAKNSIVQKMVLEYGSNRTADFISDLTFVLDKWLSGQGFSIGLEDIMPNIRKTQEIQSTTYNQLQSKIAELGPRPEDPSERIKYEMQVLSILKTSSEVGSKIFKEAIEPLGTKNRFLVMSKSGAKGAEFNLAQIMVMLGQQMYDGKRLPTAMSGGTRALSAFSSDNLGIEARGFIRNSFFTGLSPTEYFFHHMGGRQGLNDTAIKTSQSGDAHNRINSALENFMVMPDGTVRNPSGVVIQFIYGYDGFSGSGLQVLKTDVGRMTTFFDAKAAVKRINIRYGQRE